MLIRLLLLFTIIPLIELFILIKIGTVIGALWTILIVVGTGVTGALLARHHGFGVWRRIQERMQQGLFPADELLDGLLILIAGVVLITPGIITDVLGFTLLIPFTRQLYKRWLKKRFTGMMDRGSYRASDFFHNRTIHRAGPDEGNSE
jgi:UPF0716 protein FxsA